MRTRILTLALVLLIAFSSHFIAHDQLRMDAESPVSIKVLTDSTFILIDAADAP